MRNLLAWLGIELTTKVKDGKYWYRYIKLKAQTVTMTFSIHHYRWFDIKCLRTHRQDFLSWLVGHSEDVDIALGWVSIEYLRKF